MAKSKSTLEAERIALQYKLNDMQMLLEETGVGTWGYDGATNTLILDRVCREMFDIDDHAELDMSHMKERLHPDDIDLYWQAVADSLKSGYFSHSYRIVRKNGVVRFINGRGRTTPGGGGVAPGVRGVCIDVTDRRNLESKLRSTESRMQELADGVPGLFSFIDRDYRVVFMSSRYREIFDRSEGQLVNKHIADIIGQEAFNQRRDRYDRALAGQTVHHEASRRMPDGREVYFTITHLPHRNENHEIQGVLSLAIDITERRNIEQVLASQSEELSRSNRDLEQFAYVASHDLKAPLRSIELLVQWLNEDLSGHEEGEVQENLRLLEQRAQRLNRLLDDLMEYSRAGRRVGTLKSVDTAALVDDIGKLLAPPGSMRIVADASLPAIDAYHAPLEQVFRNLINNAIKHHPTQTGTVKVSATDQGDAVLFVVEDDGDGISEIYTEKIFQMFQTLQPRDEREGSGMGLAIVKRIIDWQGGRIWFHAGSGGKGAVFKFIWNKNPLVPDIGDSKSKKVPVNVQQKNAAHQNPSG
ncbi:MAG: sensor histidine kinase [Gammaproteobacteria bacterium]